MVELKERKWEMIKKSEALKRLDTEDRQQATNLVNRIDTALAKYDGVPVIVAITDGTSGKVINQIMREYTIDGGWSVKEDDGDQRDPGHDLIFS